MFARPLVCFVAWALVFGTCSPQKAEFGKQYVLPMSLRDARGKPLTFPDPNARATVAIFLATDCPIGNRYAPEIRRIERAFGLKGIVFVHFYPEIGGTATKVSRHARQFGFTARSVLDPKGGIAKKLGATVTPEAAVVAASGETLYRGRIDDYNVEHGRVRPNYRRDLRIALDEILAGKPVSVPRTAAIGCFIPKG